MVYNTKYMILYFYRTVPGVVFTVIAIILVVNVAFESLFYS